MGCAAGKSAVGPVFEGRNGDARKLSTGTFIIPEPQETLQDVPTPPVVPKGLAFEIPLDENQDGNLKAPPKRFQKPLEQQASLTHEILEEKQAEAEQRRLQILNQRIQSARSKLIIKRPMSTFGNNESAILESMSREPSTVEL